MYTDLTVTTLNRIPDAGRIELTFTNVVIHLTNWKLDADAAANGNTGYCFIQWFGWDYTCTTDTGKLTIEFVGDLPDNTTF